MKRIRVTDVIGSGGQGRVYKCTDGSGRYFAIKFFPLTCEGIPLDEPIALANLDHPNIVSVIQMDVSEESVFIIEELGDSDLKGKKLQAMESTRAMVHILRALDYIHKKGAVHGDVKTRNVIVFNGQHPTYKMGDFGTLSWFPRSSIPSTVEYRSPELWEDRISTSKSDMWAFGCLVFELLYGTPLISRESGVTKEYYLDMIRGMQRLIGYGTESKSVPVLPVGFPSGSVIHSIIVDCLHPNPGSRPTAEDLLDRLGERHTACGHQVVTPITALPPNISRTLHKIANDVRGEVLAVASQILSQIPLDRSVRLRIAVCCWMASKLVTGRPCRGLPFREKTLLDEERKICGLTGFRICIQPPVNACGTMTSTPREIRRGSL